MSAPLPSVRLKELLSVVLFLALTGCNTGPSCEERGGKIEYTHTIFIYQPALKMMWQYPQYRCVMPEQGDTPNGPLNRLAESGSELK